MISTINCRYKIFQEAIHTQDFDFIRHTALSFLNELKIPKYITYNNIIYPLDILFNLKKDAIVLQDVGGNVLWSNHRGCYHRRNGDCAGCPINAPRTTRRPICATSMKKLFYVAPLYDHFIILLKKLS